MCRKKGCQFTVQLALKDVQEIIRMYVESSGNERQ